MADGVPTFWTHDSLSSDCGGDDADGLTVATESVLVTPLLIALNVAFFILMTTNGASLLDPDALHPSADCLVRWGASYGPLTTHGQPWRAFTALFVHTGFFHLLINMAALAVIGPVVERLFGNAAFAVLYVLSGIGGSIVSLAWHPFFIAAGASGAIFGLLGGLVGLLLLHPDGTLCGRRKTLAVCGFLLDMLPHGSKEGVDVGAHLGGLAIGFLVGCLLTSLTLKANPDNRLAQTFAVALVGVGIAAGAVARVPVVDDLGSEIQEFSAMEKKSETLFNDSLRKLKSGQMRPEEFTALVENDLLPPWNAVRNRISTLRISERQRPVAKRIVEYMALRAEGWSLLAKAVRADDMDMVRMANEKQAAADAISGKIKDPDNGGA